MTHSAIPIPPRVDHFVIERTLGSGGMGVVVAAWDERLHRAVALKLLHNSTASGPAIRFWREARAAAAVHHPAVCQVFDVGETAEYCYIAMELLDGETMATRLTRGPIPVGETIALALTILDALAAIHAQGLLHRDLKPANLMLTAHGLKVLDFGLARTTFAATDSLATGELTQPGTLVGTPAYIAPEVLRGSPADARSDLFAVGAVLFEMLAGRRAFLGGTPIEIAHAVLHERPPALTGGPTVAAVDRVLRQALDKEPARRFASALDMAAAIRKIQQPDIAARVVARPTRRLIVLPFRALRRDEDTEFLSASLPEALTAALSQLDSVVVRSAIVGARFGDSPDLARLSTEGDVDVAVTGSLFRIGHEMRLTAQLVEVPSGAVLHSTTYQANAQNIVELYDAIVKNIASGLGDQLSQADEARLARNAPASPTAYALFLHANELTRDRRRLPDAVSQYRESLARDPAYAPAWAQLGRAYRLRSKYESTPAQHLELAREALEHALATDPDLDLAHSVFALLETDLGLSRDAMIRLTQRAMKRDAAPDIYSGLVYACRFCGLVDESITFHHEARRLDPSVPTSVTQSYFQIANYPLCLETAGDDVGYIAPAALDMIGRRADAIEQLRSRLDGVRQLSGGFLLIDSLLATMLGGRRCLQDVEAFLKGGYVGCEAHVYLARQLIYLSETDAGLAQLQKSVDAGFHHAEWLTTDPWFAAARSRGEFERIVSQSRRESEASRAAFIAAGGDRLLARRTVADTSAYRRKPQGDLIPDSDSPNPVAPTQSP